MAYFLRTPAAVVLVTALEVGSAHSATISVGTGSGFRDSVVTLPIRFQGDGETKSFTADIRFSGTNLSLAAAPVAAGGATCVRDTNSLTTVRVSITLANPLPSDVRYCDLPIRVSGTAAGGIEPVTVISSLCTDDLGSAACMVSNGQVSISGVQTSLPEGASIVIAGYQGTASESRRVRITNAGAAPLTVSCGLSQTTDSGLTLTSSPNSIPVSATQEAIIACALPASAGGDRLGQLTCTTSDTVRNRLSYGLYCTTVRTGEPLPNDQLLDNQIKAGDQLGASAAQGTVQAGTGTGKGTLIQGLGTSVILLGAPFGGGDSRGRVILFEGSTQSTQVVTGKLAGKADANAMRPVAVFAPPPLSAMAKASVIPLDLFGLSVALSATSQLVGVAAPQGGANGQGVVYIYARPNTAGGWEDLNLANPAVPPIEIPAPVNIPNQSVAMFGNSIAFAPNGDLVVGAPGTDVAGTQDAGAVFRFVANGSGGFNTSSPDTLNSTAAIANGSFGDSVAVSSEALVVGAPQEGTSQTGAVYVFGVAGGSLLAPIVVPGGVAGTRFGDSVATQGSTIVVGAPGADTSAGTDSGAAMVFLDPPTGPPSLISTLLPALGATQGAGTSVSLNGGLIVVGAPDANSGPNAGPGKAYVYDQEASYASQESPAQILEAPAGAAGDQFGKAVSAGTGQIVVGAPMDDITLSDNSVLQDAGQASPFGLLRIFRNGFEGDGP